MKRVINANYIPDMTERYPEGMRDVREEEYDAYSSESRTLTKIGKEVFTISADKYSSHIEEDTGRNPYWAEAKFPGEGEYRLYKGREFQGVIPDGFDTQNEYDLFVAQFLYDKNNK